MEKHSRYTEKRSFLTLGILALLEEHGELTRKELCEYLGRDKLEVSGVITRLSRRSKTLPKRIYITRYTHEDFWMNRWIPVYALGSRRNAVKPPPQSRKEIWHRYYYSHKKKVNSVFMLGMTRQQRRDHASATLNLRDIDNERADIRIVQG